MKLTSLIYLGTYALSWQVSAIEYRFSLLTSYNAEFVYFSIDNSGKKILKGTWHDQLTVNQNTLIRKVERTPTGQATDLIRTVAAHSLNYTPKFINQRFGPNLSGLYSASLNGDELTQFLLANDASPAKVQTNKMVGELIEANLQGVLVAALPFDEYEEISISNYQAGSQPQTVKTTFKVHGREWIYVDDTRYEAWKVEEPNSRWTYWVQKKPPYLLKVSHPGANGEMLISELTDFSQ